MAIGAAPVDHEETVGSTGQGLVPTLTMALLAQARLLVFQQIPVNRPVGLMTIEAILLHGRMLPQNRCFFFPVTFVALVIDAVGGDQLDRLGTMRIVAARAGHLADAA